MKSILCILIVCFALRLNASTDSLQMDTTSFAYGNVMYEKGEFQKAAFVYSSLLQTNGPSPIVYYNLGNCYYRMQQTGQAILHYERALIYAPNYTDARYNLELANRRTRDQVEAVPRPLVSIWWENFSTLFTSTTWGIISIICIWIAAAGWAVFLLQIFRKWQRPAFYSFLLFFLLGIIALMGHFGRRAFDDANFYVIVMSPSSIIKSEPSETSTNLSLIHEGFKLKLLRTEGDWAEVEMPDKQIGWIRESDYESIRTALSKL